MNTISTAQARLRSIIESAHVLDGFLADVALLTTDDSPLLPIDAARLLLRLDRIASRLEDIVFKLASDSELVARHQEGGA